LILLKRNIKLIDYYYKLKLVLDGEYNKNENRKMNIKNIDDFEED